ncbi:Glycosyltransferase [Flavobacterium sp. 9AF]|uniref:glycosyltransferase n=1 Tax=Flavobacterium sp. 9AF TaxID=2653142 RepID=UPI0012EF92C6|nr:glycosyltransferase [Flavobacterium sp. 9AF]VXC31628.1 Glycosyltransferase [Flavobacterium sp. 9AF]
MKIGIVLPSVPAYSETFFVSKINGLQENGFQVVLFVNDYQENSKINCQIISAPKFSKNKLKNAFISIYYLFRSLFLKFKPVKKMYFLDKKDNLSFSDRIKNIIINSHILNHELDWLHFGFGTMAIYRENVAEAIGAKMAISFRGFDHYVYPLKDKKCYELVFSKKIKFHVLSEGMKKDLLSFGIEEKNIVKITPAIDENLFFSDLKFVDKPVFLTIARLHWIKGLDYIIESLSILKAKGHNFEYRIIGEGIEKEKLQFLVHQLGLNDKVVFLGKLSPIQVKEELENASYYIQYSHQEGFCNAVLEAQSMGKICLVSDADGLIENVIDNETGFVVPKRNSEILANKIILALKLGTDAKEILINNAKKRIATNFSIEDQKIKFIDFYKNQFN